MSRRILLFALVVSLAWPPGLRAQAAASDPEVLKGIREVEDGDYDPAILTLDTAARRLAADPARTRELAQAYLYLGIAYIGKGHEAAAKAKFREAVKQVGDLSLSPDKFPPKVIDLFEAAREEARTEGPPRPAPSPAASPASTTAARSGAAPAKKGGGGKTILIVGGIAAAGAAVALAAGGGGSGSGSSSSGSTPPTTLAPAPAGSSLQRQDSVANQEQKGYVVTASRAGTLTAKVMWQNRDVVLSLDCQESNPPYTPCQGTYTRLNDTAAQYVTQVQQKEYLVLVSNFSGRPGAENYTVLIEYP